MTPYTPRFSTRSFAAVRFAPLDLSSTYSTSIFRPLTPPSRLARSTRAWHALSEPWKVELAPPVPHHINPSFPYLAVTPGTFVVVDCAPAVVVTNVTAARLATATLTTARTARVRCCFIRDSPPGNRSVELTVRAT